MNSECPAESTDNLKSCMSEMLSDQEGGDGPFYPQICMVLPDDLSLSTDNATTRPIDEEISDKVRPDLMEEIDLSTSEFRGSISAKRSCTESSIVQSDQDFTELSDTKHKQDALDLMSSIPDNISLNIDSTASRMSIPEYFGDIANQVGEIIRKIVSPTNSPKNSHHGDDSFVNGGSTSINDIFPKIDDDLRLMADVHQVQGEEHKSSESDHCETNDMFISTEVDREDISMEIQNVTTDVCSVERAIEHTELRECETTILQLSENSAVGSIGFHSPVVQRSTDEDASELNAVEKMHPENKFTGLIDAAIDQRNAAKITVPRLCNAPGTMSPDQISKDPPAKLLSHKNHEPSLDCEAGTPHCVKDDRDGVLSNMMPGENSPAALTADDLSFDDVSFDESSEGTITSSNTRRNRFVQQGNLPSQKCQERKEKPTDAVSDSLSKVTSLPRVTKKGASATSNNCPTPTNKRDEARGHVSGKAQKISKCEVVGLMTTSHASSSQIMNGREQPTPVVESSSVDSLDFSESYHRDKSVLNHSVSGISYQSAIKDDHSIASETADTISSTWHQNHEMVLSRLMKEQRERSLTKSNPNPNECSGNLQTKLSDDHSITVETVSSLMSYDNLAQHDTEASKGRKKKADNRSKSKIPTKESLRSPTLKLSDDRSLASEDMCSSMSSSWHHRLANSETVASRLMKEQRLKSPTKGSPHPREYYGKLQTKLSDDHSIANETVGSIMSCDTWYLRLAQHDTEASKGRKKKADKHSNSKIHTKESLRSPTLKLSDDRSLASEDMCSVSSFWHHRLANHETVSSRLRLKSPTKSSTHPREYHGKLQAKLSDDHSIANETVGSLMSCDTWFIRLAQHDTEASKSRKVNDNNRSNSKSQKNKSLRSPSYAYRRSSTPKGGVMHLHEKFKRCLDIASRSADGENQLASFLDGFILKGRECLEEHETRQPSDLTQRA